VYEPADADLAAIASLSPANDDFLQRKAGAWAVRSPAHVGSDLDTNRGRALRQWYSALADRHFAPAKVAMLGDSFTEGQGASTRVNRWTDRLRTQLRTRYPSDGIGSGGGAGYLATGSATTPSMSVWTPSGPATTAGWFGWAAYGIQVEAGGSITATVTGTAIDVVYPTGSGSTVSTTVDGGTPDIFNEDAGTTDGNAHRVSLGTSGSHTVVIAPSGGTIFLDGIVVYDGDESAGITFIPLGHTGYTGANFITLIGSYSSGSIGPKDADLWIIELGLNDFGTGVSPTTFQSNLQSIIATVKSITVGKVPSFVLMAPCDCAGGTYPWSQYVDAMWAVAAADADVCVYDGRSRMGACGATPLFAEDTFHPSNRGHSFLADSLADFLAAA
jgi:lysophospholipase L1-like esterase